MKSFPFTEGLLKRYAGFTLTEIMLVLLIIGMVAAIAMPGFVQSRRNARRNVCVNNMRLISAAKEQAALENSYAETYVPTQAEMLPYIKGNTMPVCPGNGTYTINAVSVAPVCSNSAAPESHTL